MLCGTAFFLFLSNTGAGIFFALAFIAAAAAVLRGKIPAAEFSAGRVMIIPALFASWHFICALTGVDTRASLKETGKLYVIAVLFLAAGGAASKQKLKAVLAAFAAGAAVLGTYAIVMTILHKSIGGDTGFRAASFFGHYMHAAGVLAAVVIITAALAVHEIREKRWKPAGLYAAAFVLSSAGLLFTFTRGSWIAAAAGIFIYLFFTDKKAVLAGVVVFALFIFAMKDTSYMERFKSSFVTKQGTSSGERLLMWKAGLKIVKDNPVTGIGGGSVRKVYPSYSEPGARELDHTHLHNNLVQAAVTNGITGLVLLIAVFLSLWRVFYVSYRRARDPWLKNVILAVLCFGIGFFINGFFETNIYLLQVSLMFWFLNGLGFAAVKADEKN